MSLYYCSSCADTIPLHKPRINCNDCRFHNICANCYVLNIFTGQHVQGHTTRVIPKSGRVLPPPLPARHSPTTIPQPQPQGRPEIGRRPVGGPSISQQIPEYVSQPIPSPYGHPVGNINRMSDHHKLLHLLLLRVPCMLELHTRYHNMLFLHSKVNRRI